MSNSLSWNVTIGQDYKQQEGIVLGSNFLDQDAFTKHFATIVKQQQTQFENEFERVWTTAEKWSSNFIKNGERVSIVTVLNNLQPVAEAFARFIGGSQGQLGGEISLLTTFNFGSKDQETYFVPMENTVYHERDEMGRFVYKNTQKNLNTLMTQTNGLVKINQALKSHLNGFNTQLRARATLTKDDYIFLRKWSYNNLRERYNRVTENHGTHRVSLATYFWGNGYLHGYISEAYGAHLAMKHPDFLQGHINKLHKSVIVEHGGPASIDLYQLLKSTKGNTSSQLSGDIVVVDSDGNVQFNIQSKASTRGAYDFTITYQKFMQNIDKFRELYYDCTQNPNLINQSAKQIFNMFKTSAWVPIRKKLEEEIAFEIEEINSQVGPRFKG